MSPSVVIGESALNPAFALDCPVPPFAIDTCPVMLNATLPDEGLLTAMFVPLCQLMVVWLEVFVPFT
jgi:hypothetical protein